MHTYNLWHNLYHNLPMWEVVMGERVFSHKLAIISLPTTTRYKLKHQYCSTFLATFFQLSKWKLMTKQWRLQEFCPGCSYSTLKKFRVISVYFRCFGKYQPKFKIWPAWSLCLKKKMFLKSKQIFILYTEKPQN